MASIPSPATESSPRFQALPTTYRGIRMRSRLESRWAVFFDHLDIPWCYEPEGFLLPTGEAYLPDFYIPRWDAYVEIKHKAIPNELVKCDVLSSESGSKVLLIEGHPGEGTYTIHAFGPRNTPNTCPGLCEFAYDRRDDDVYWLVGGDSECACILDKGKTDHDRWPIVHGGTLPTAYEAAIHFWQDYRGSR